MIKIGDYVTRKSCQNDIVFKVIDVSDTRSKYGKKIALWRVNKVYEEQVIESLENKYGELANKETLYEALKSVAYNLTEDNYSDYLNDLINNKDNTKLEFINDDVIERKYKELLQNSIGYMLVNRCGLDPKPHFVESDFIEISLFNHIDTLTRLGNAVSDISEMGLREIYNTLKNIRLNEIEKIRTFDKEKNKVYDDSEKSESVERRDFDEHRVQENGRLRDNESSSEREDGTIRKILNNDVELLEETQQQSISNTDDERPNEVGRSNEQHQEFSRGSSNQRIDLQLSTDENTNDSILFSDGNKNTLLTEKEKNDISKQERTQLSLFGSKDCKYNIPKCHNQNIQYGNTIKSICIDLMNNLYNSTDGTTRFIEDITNGGMTTSKGTLHLWKNDIANKLNLEIQNIEYKLLEGYYLNHDESQINGDGYNILCACNKFYARLWIHKKNLKKH